VQAETLLQMLHGFNEEEEAQPELYEVLINYLTSKHLALRSMAHWHLVRLVPAGRKIAYNPLDSKESWERAQTEWQKLIPPGKLPPKQGAATNGK
jgi:hypothetical protein